MLNKPPIARAYWVEPGKFMAGLYPGAKDPQVAQEKVEALLEAGMQVFVNLMEEDEANYAGEAFYPYERDLGSLSGRMGFSAEMSRFPIRDNDVPTADHMVSILDFIDRSVAANKPLYVHCWGGRGRTGTVVGCFLMRHGLATDSDVLQKIEGLRSGGYGMVGNSPETAPQTEMVLNWKQGQ